MLDGRGPLGGSRPQPLTQSALGSSSCPEAPAPPIRLFWFRPADWAGPWGRRSHNALGRAAAVAAASATASGRRWRKAERQI